MSEKAKEISKKMQDAAKKNFSRLKELAGMQRRTPMEMGWIAAEMKEKNQFPLMGYNNENECRIALRIGRSTWFRYIGLADSFQKLEKDEFCKMIAENADHLAKLDERMRYRKDLVKAAQEMTEADFEKLLVKHRAKDEDADEDDIVVTLKLRMTEGQKKAITDTFGWFAKQNDIPADNESKILELICAEVKHRNPIVTAMMKVTGQLGQTAKILQDGGNLSADEVIKIAAESVASCFRAMCEAAGIKPEAALKAA
ncbi:MAG TPA: hypothetical protein VFY05_04790 [Candidatus Angelobacter sp.]|nr:hypothetical protein [Candidatus Angelobacter sp.]